MGIVLSLLTLMGLMTTDGADGSDRAAALHTALARAEMLHEASRRHHDPALDFPDADADAEREVSLELVHMELDGGYLARTCVCDEKRVRDLRLMIAYARMLRLMGHSDSEIGDTLAARAGEHGTRVRALVDVAGIDNMHRFICVDYLRAALDQGMPAETLRDYITDLAPAPVRPGRNDDKVRIAAAN